MNAKTLFTETLVNSAKNFHQFGFNVMETADVHVVKALHAVLDKLPWVTEEARGALDTWIETLRNGRNRVKNLVEDQIKTFENFASTL